MKAYLHLLKHFLHESYNIDVDDGGEVFENCGYKEAKEAIESVGESTVTIYEWVAEWTEAIPNIAYVSKKVKRKIGWALVIPDLDPTETVADFSGKLIDDWHNSYMEKYDV